MSPAFSTNATNELLLAFVSTDYVSGSNTVVQSVSGGGLTWQLVTRTNTQPGTAEIWRAFAASKLSNVTVTATLSNSVASSLTVASYSGVDISGSNGSGAIGATGTANGTSAPSASLVTTRSNSLVVGVGNDYDNATARTVPAGQSLIHQDLASVGDTYWVQSQTSPTPVSGTTVTINDTAPTGDRFNLSIAEILPAPVAPQTFSISGTASPTSAGAGATVTLTGPASATMTADTSGNFKFTGLANGSYTVTVTRSGYTFSPTSAPVALNGANVSGVNFTGTANPPQTWSVSGSLGASGASATVTLSGAASATTTADSSGNFSFSGLANGSYTVTPSKAGYTFSPASQSVAVNSANVTGVSFTANAQTWSISGTVSTSGAGATMTLSGAASKTVTADASGNFSFSGLANGNYTVTPSKAGYAFSPASQAVVMNSANVTGVSFTTTAQTWSISGSLSASGASATVTLSGAASATTTADSSGNYSFSGLANGNYTVTPSKAGYAFSPVSQAVVMNSANVTGVNFTAGAQTYSITGTITPTTAGASATVTLSGAASKTVTADASGNFSFTGLANGTYTVTPTKSGYTFSPLSRSVTISGANVSALSFSGTAQQTIFSISGTVTPSSIGSGTIVSLSGASSASTVANASGSYSFAGLANGTYTLTPSNSGYTFTPSSLTVTVNGANVTAGSFTGAAVTSAVVTIDAKTSIDLSSAGKTITSAKFSTTGSNELILAFIASDYKSGSNTTVTSVTGCGLTWNLVIRTNTQKGTAEIWRAFAKTPLANVTVAATVSQSVLSSMTVMAFKGVDATGTNGSGAIGAVETANASSGAPKATLTTTRNGSWIFGVGNDYDNAIARTPLAGQSLVHQDLASVGDTYWVQMQSTPNPLSGTLVTFGDSAPTSDRYNLSVVEVLPAN